MSDQPNLPFSSPVMPKMYDGDKVISFRCHKAIGCFNACCKSIDITLTPYDIIRLKNRLGVTSAQFLREYTVPFEFEKDGIAGVKLKSVEGGSACRFMTDEGCSVYEDRPTACRYYPVALVSMRKQDEYTDSDSYALVEESHCLGHQEDRSLTIDAYREEQGVKEYDELSRGWRQLILKKKSSGATIGKPSLRSRRFFFMACYDIDTFREFVRSDGFHSSFALPTAEYEALLVDEVALLQFGYRLLRQVMFGEESIEVVADARNAVQLKQQANYIAEEEAARPKVWHDYDPALEPVDL